MKKIESFYTLRKKLKSIRTKEIMFVKKQKDDLGILLYAPKSPPSLSPLTPTKTLQILDSTLNPIGIDRKMYKSNKFCTVLCVNHFKSQAHPKRLQ